MAAAELFGRRIFARAVELPQQANDAGEEPTRKDKTGRSSRVAMERWGQAGGGEILSAGNSCRAFFGREGLPGAGCTGAVGVLLRLCLGGCEQEEHCLGNRRADGLFRALSQSSGRDPRIACLKDTLALPSVRLRSTSMADDMYREVAPGYHPPFSETPARRLHSHGQTDGRVQCFSAPTHRLRLARSAIPLEKLASIRHKNAGRRARKTGTVLPANKSTGTNSSHLCRPVVVLFSAT